MAHYYFDLKDGATQRDHAGVELRSDDDAIARAHVLAGEIGNQGAVRDHACHVSVINENGHEVTRVPVSSESRPRSTAGLKKIS